MDMNELEIGKEVRKTNHDIKVFIDRSISGETSKCQALTGIEGMLVDYIYHHENIYASDLMKNFNLQKATVSQGLGRLVKKGIIKEAVDPLDKRKKILSLTEKGIRGHLDFFRIYETLIPVIEKGISPEEKALFIDICHRIRKNVGGDYE